jgi:hypothetical protein
MRTLFAVAVLSGLVAAGANPAAAEDWGKALKGRVVWDGGAVPKPEPVNVAANMDGPKCQAAAKGKLVYETWVVNPKNKGVRWTFVWLAPADPKDRTAKLPVHPNLKNPPDKPAEMDQPCCMFEPHALGIREGQELIVKNSAAFAHNTRYNGNPLRNPGRSVLIPPGAQLDIKELVADRLPVMVKCDLHPWMSAWVRVFDHPYFAVTDEDGNFDIKDVPAGNYRLMVWHETGYLGGAEGRTGTPIQIAKNKVTDVGALKLKPPPEK